MLYVDDRLPTHPKIFKAGARLGDNGAAQALALFVAGLAYTREHLTDGFLPDGFVSSCGLVQTPQSVASALASRGVRLWHRTRGGYQIHDYHDWNKSASEIKEIRDKWRKKKAAQRRGSNGQFQDDCRTVSPGDVYRDSRVRDPRSTYVQSHDREIRVVSTDRVQTARFARGIQKMKTPTHRILCAMLRAELEYADDPIANAIEGVKIRLARQGFAYPAGDRLDAAIQAVEHARRKRPA